MPAHQAEDDRHHAAEFLKLLDAWLPLRLAERTRLHVQARVEPNGLATKILKGLETHARGAARFVASQTRRSDSSDVLWWINGQLSDDFSRDDETARAFHRIRHTVDNALLQVDGQQTAGVGMTESNSILLKIERLKELLVIRANGREVDEDEYSMTAGQLIERLTPILRGWALYHRHAASKRTFTQVDRRVFRWLWRWARRRHDRQTAAWVKARYFPRVDSRGWVFTGELPSKEGPPHTVHLYTAERTRIRRHVKIQGAANPYDPTWEPYFEERVTFQMQDTLTGQGITRYLWLEQQGKCLLCDQPLTPEAGWQHHHVQRRVYGGAATVDNLVLLHPNCHRQAHSRGLVVAKAASREGRS